jgi:hypothetical protein
MYGLDTEHFIMGPEKVTKKTEISFGYFCAENR